MKSSPPPPIDPDDSNDDDATGVKPFKPTSKSSPITIPPPNFMRTIRPMEDQYSIRKYIPLPENKRSARPGTSATSPSDNSYRQSELALLSSHDFKNMPFNDNVNNFRGTPSRYNNKGSSPLSTPPPSALPVGGSLTLPPTHNHNLLNRSKNNNMRQLSRNRFREPPRPLDTQFGEPVQPSRAGRGSNSNRNASPSSSPNSSSDSGCNEESSAYNRRSGSYGRHTEC